MTDKPLEVCPKCNKQVVYLKSYQKKDTIDFEIICMDGHKTSFTITNKIRTAHKNFIREKIFSCAICGGPAFPDYENEFVKELDKTSFKVKCKAGCNDNYLREYQKELPKECPKCGAPLTEEKLEKLKTQAIIDCSKCGLWAMYCY
ncbi:MAG: hypothetical protein ACFFCM_07220 [Promethearchaeota archaeon]